MARLGYKRSAKKCKEKFENVHKYYKRTKEGRAGRHDGKTYKFFTELEALQTVSSPGSSLPPPPPALASPPVAAPVTSLQAPPVSLTIQFGDPIMSVPSTTVPPATGMQPPTLSHIFPVTAAAVPPASSPLGLIFSSNSSSLSPGSGDDEDDEEDVEGEPSTAGSSRKRKRAAEMSSVSEGRRMMEYFEGLMKRVMQKQEEMQKRFLEAIEKREQDRLAREETWRRQEMYRLAREHEIMAQERAVSASRDATIMSFLQKITGQTIQLPTTATVTAVPVVSPRAPPPPQASAAVPPPSRTQPQQQPQRRHPLSQLPQTYQPMPPDEVIAAIPEQQVPPPPQEIIGMSGGGVGGRGEVPSSSRWPKVEVLALIGMRSGMESKYQEAGPKGPLWEEISDGMHRLGYKRNPKRCKEKWENINKYFKKVKESNKKRPDDAKTCPYFHELDALYRKKALSGQSSGIEIRLDAPASVVAEAQTGGVIVAADLEGPKNGGPDGEGTESAKKPEDTVKEMNHRSEQQQSREVDFGDKADEADKDNLDQDENEEELDEDEDEDEDMEEERKMAYKIEYQQQRQNAGPPNGGGSGSAPPFVTMVQ